MASIRAAIIFSCLGVALAWAAEPETMWLIPADEQCASGMALSTTPLCIYRWRATRGFEPQFRFYAYRPTLTAFRKFDASGRRVYEDCEGKFQGKAVDIELDEFDMAREHAGEMQTAVYRACFASLPATAGKYLTPQ